MFAIAYRKNNFNLSSIRWFSFVSKIQEIKFTYDIVVNEFKGLFYSFGLICLIEVLAWYGLLWFQEVILSSNKLCVDMILTRLGLYTMLLCKNLEILDCLRTLIALNPSTLSLLENWFPTPQDWTILQKH